MRQGLSASRHLAETHATRVRQGTTIQVPVLRPQNQATRQSVSAYSHQSSREECLLQQHLMLALNVTRARYHFRVTTFAVFPNYSISIFYSATLYTLELMWIKETLTVTIEIELYCGHCVKQLVARNKYADTIA